jgi:hypothetical protein
VKMTRSRKFVIGVAVCEMRGARKESWRVNILTDFVGTYSVSL